MIDKKLLNVLMNRLLVKEKEFLNENNLTEGKKIKELKKIIEDGVKANDN